MDFILERTEQSIKSLQTIHFSEPGLFTNAIVKRPNITTLLKDPTPDEASLYRISKTEFRPERIDGKSIYHIEPSEEPRRTVVQIPRIQESSPDPPTSPNVVPECDTEDVGQLCEMALNLIRKYPTLVGDGEILEKVYSFEKENRLMESEIHELELKIENQKSKLALLNVNYTDLPRDDEDIEECIRREEEAIRGLEQELENYQQQG